MMIARTWRGWTRAEDTETYIAYLHETGMREYRETPGNQAAYILHRTVGDRTEFITLTFWDSIESVKAFAGEEYKNAVFYAEDDRFLVERELTTNHYEVVTPPERAA